MKKVISFFLLAIIATSSAGPIFGQKSRLSRLTAKKSAVKPTIVKSAQFSRVEGYSDGNGAYLRWQMDFEKNNTGFYVYRYDSSGPKLVSEYMVGGSATRVGTQILYGETYNLFDPEGEYGSAYVVENVNGDGSTTRSDTFTANYVKKLQSITGRTSRDFQRQAKSATPVLSSDEMVLPKDLASEVASAATSAENATHTWVVAQPGVRIGVKNEGVHRIARAQLEANGFNVNSNPSLWQLYSEGVERPLIIGGNGDYIEFFGKGVDTVESDTQMYYLLVGSTAGKRITSRVARLPQGTVQAPSYLQTFVRKERFIYINALFNGDEGNYFGRGIGVNVTNMTFTLTGVDFNSANSTIDLNFQGFSSGDHTVELILNDIPISPASGEGVTQYTKTQEIPTSLLREGSNSLKMRSIGPAGDGSFFDTMNLTFGRKHIAEQNKLKFFTRNYRNARIEGFGSANVRVFDTTAENEPVLVTNLPVQEAAPGNFRINMPAGRGRLFYAVEDSGLLSPASLSPNNPALLGVTSNEGKLVIIAYKDWMTQAEAWANYRRGQGDTVKVVEVSEIYDEFNYGVLSSNSIKSFLQYAKENWQTPPSYVLIIGDASYDSRNFEGLGFFNFVPTLTVTTTYSETCSDEALADFDNDGLSEIAIGRIAVRSAAAVTSALTRVTTFEQNLANPLGRGALFVYDIPNGYDFRAMSERMRDQLPGTVSSTMVGRGLAPPNNELTLDPNAQANTIAAMNTGKYVVNYAGHGTTGGWASSTFFSNAHVPQLTNSANTSIFMMLTCLNGYFHGLDKSLAETLIESTNGGAVASWASSGLTTADFQEIMGSRFLNKLGTAPPNTRMGDLILDAKAQVPGGSDVRFSWALLGDPMLKVR